MGKSKKSFYLILILVFMQVFLFGCKKIEPKKNIDDKGQNYIDYSKKKNEFENNNFIKRDIKDIFDIKIMDELMIENTMNEKYFLKKTAQSDLLFSAFSNILNNTIKNQIIYYRLDICSSEFEYFKKYDIGKYKNLISKIENKYEIPRDKYFIEGRENLGLLENVKDGKSYLEIDNKTFGHDKNILPQNDKIFYYTLIGGKIKYAFIFKDTNIFNIKDENILLNNYDAFEKPNSLKFNLGYIGKDIVVNSVDESLKNSEEIKIPYYVSIIGDGVFSNFTNLKKIDLKNIREIKKEAFKNTKLEKIDLPNLVKLGEMAFSKCENLTAANMPILTEIDYKSFENCKNLEDIYLDNCNYIKDYAFSNCYKLKFKKDILNISLEKLAFNNCPNYEIAREDKLNIKNDTLIGFIDKVGSNLYIKEVVIPSSVKKIADRAFFHTDINKINLSNVEVIGNDAFAYCHSLKKIDIENTKKLGEGSFYECTKLEEIKNLNNLKKISKSAFAYCKMLKSIDLGLVNEVDNYAFGSCKNISQIDLKNVEILGDRVFSTCDKLSKIDLRNIKKIGNEIFFESDITRTILINKSPNGENDNYKVLNGKKVYRKLDNKLILSVN